MAQWKEKEADRYSHDKWYENIWFHHKFHILIGALLVIFIAVLFFSTNMNDTTDMYILFVTDSPEIYTEKTETLKSILTQYASDKNGDGEVLLYIENLYIGEEFDSANVYKNKEKIMTALRSGNSMFVIADNIGAQYLIAADVCADLTEIITENGAENLDLDGKMWNWTDSEFKSENNEFYEMFDDIPLYFGIRVFEGTISELTENATQNYEMAKDLLFAIASNSKPE